MQKRYAQSVAVFSLLCAVGMLIARSTDHRDAGRILIYLASTSYIVVALLAGAHRTAFGRLVLAGVICCWIGDIVGPKNFLAGAMAFLIGHIFFIPAFFVRGVTRNSVLLGLLSYGIISAAALAWIGPQVPPEERPVIFTYTAIIGLMGAVSVGTWHADWTLPVGAGIFYISDLFLAQTAFLDGGFINTVLGYPLYYLAVLILAYAPMRYQRPVQQHEPVQSPG